MDLVDLLVLMDLMDPLGLGKESKWLRLEETMGKAIRLRRSTVLK